MLYPVPTLAERANNWHELTGKEIKIVIGDEPQLLLFEIFKKMGRIKILI